MGFTSTSVRASAKRVDGTTSYIPYFDISGNASQQRIAVDKTGALLSNAYLTAEQAKARALGSLPCRVYTDGERGREKVNDHPLTILCQRRWNPLMSAQTGWQWTSVRRDTFGTAYVRVEWDRGMPVAFWPVDAPVETLYDPTVRISPVRYKVGSGDKFTPAKTYLSHEMLVFPTCISTDGGVTGRSLAELAAADIGLSIDLTRFYSNIIGKGFNPGGWLEHPESLDNKEVQAIGEKNRILSGPGHAGELRIFDRGLKYHSVGSTMAEADIIKQEEFVLQSVARAVYVQPNKVFDFSRATYSNIEAAGIAFVTDTMTNEVTAIESEVGKLFLAMDQPNNYVKFDLRGLQRGDFLSQTTAFTAGVYGGYVKRSEAREWMDLPFADGTDELLQPAAYFSVDPATGEAKPLPVAPKSAAASYIAPVLDDARERITARFEKDGDTPKTREFANTVLGPVARMCALAGIPFSADDEVKELIDG